MRRIMLMVFRLFFKAQYYLFRIWLYSLKNPINYEESYQYIKYATKKANKAGRVTIESMGLENIPKDNGFIFYPNHQGLFDMLVFFESCPVPFAFVLKKEVSRIILLKQVIRATGSLSIDRKDLKQSMEVIQTVIEEVKKGRNFLIFAEGTRSREGNKVIDFKGGSFKAAVKTKCPIVPCALINSFVPFDVKSTKQATVKIIYLPAIYYEEYKDWKTTEIAAEVRNRIQAAIDQNL